jgi:hypothetical protein
MFSCQTKFYTSKTKFNNRTIKHLRLGAHSLLVQFYFQSSELGYHERLEEHAFKKLRVLYLVNIRFKREGSFTLLIL